MFPTLSSKYINTVCLSPHLGISDAFWLFVKHFCFSKFYLSEFCTITLAGQTINKSGEKVLSVDRGRESRSMEMAQLSFCEENVTRDRRWSLHLFPH